MPEITVPGPNTSFERSSSLEISASLHRCMRRASLVPTANNERFDDSSFKDDSSSSCSVKVGPKNFIARRTGTLDSCYDLGELLGEGGFGQVFECTHLQTGAERAVKVLEKSMHRPELNEKVIDEFNLLRSLNHPNLIRPYEMFEDDTHFYIVTDIYRGGDLFSELEEAGCFSEVDAAIVMNTILSCGKIQFRINGIFSSKSCSSISLMKSILCS